MSRFWGIILVVLSFSVSVFGHSPIIQDIHSSAYHYQAQLLDKVESLALVLQYHPVQKTLLARRLLIQETLSKHSVYSDYPFQVYDVNRINEHGMLRPPMAWELLSVAGIPRLFSFFTSADLGGYGENQPPFVPSNPYPADGASNVPMDNLVLMWQGGDPDPEDVVQYDVYFGVHTDPPLVVSGIMETSYPVYDMVPGTLYYWKIVSRDNWDAETEGPEWSFWTLPNYPPYSPVNPIPADGASNVDRFASLSWQCNDPNPGDVLTFDVYFGTSSPPPLVVADHPDFTFTPGEMPGGTTHYWSITARDNWGAETEGPVWSFTTMVGDNSPPYTPSNPVPANGATHVPVTVNLSWTGGDPDPGDSVTYDIYLGTDPEPPLKEGNLPDTQYTPAQPLQTGTTYYWYIIARDSHSAQTVGPLWYFTTTHDEPTPTPPPSTPTPEPCVEFSVKLDMGSDYFCPGDTVFLHARLCNPEQTQYLPLWVILEIEGLFWFAPSWNDTVDYYISSPIPAGWSTREILPDFIWPTVDGGYYGAIFWGAMTTPDYQILGLYDMYTFGWGPCI